MENGVFELISPGFGASLQDRGRPGWRRFGVPESGVMDDHAAASANRLLLNPLDAPVLELLLQGAVLRVLNEGWIAISGADADAPSPMWRALQVQAGDLLEFPRNRSGVWIYLAVEGGFAGERWLGSVSGHSTAKLGQICKSGDVLRRAGSPRLELPPGVAGRFIAPSERRDYHAPPALRVWPAPQWAAFPPAVREQFFSAQWTVTARSNRVGYRLSGPRLECPLSEIISEPVRPGSIQLPENGQPIVTMRDGPTVGGYPKLGMIHPPELSWLAQCRPGQKVCFTPMEGA